jgi:6-phosphogluconolactonase
MKKLKTPLGVVNILPKDEICPAMFREIESLPDLETHMFRIGLSGGSTPKAFYKWATKNSSFVSVLNRSSSILWGCSDERYIDLEDEESNFGNAQRMMLDPIGVSEGNFRPWPVYCKPQEAAERYNRLFEEELPENPVFDLCFLGMGDDCHTASLFPGSPLLKEETDENFAAVEVPGKGMRLTITPKGLSQCTQIVVAVTGAGKAEAIQQVFNEPVDINLRPIQLLSRMHENVIWLMDEEAAAPLI